MVSKLYETKVRPRKWRFVFKYFTRKKPKKRFQKISAVQHMKKINKDRYTGKMIIKRY